ncbi:hypothetical protein HQ590_14825, partial [bacterium]|nr:hypothetical protein [bacterium]
MSLSRVRVSFVMAVFGFVLCGLSCAPYPPRPRSAPAPRTGRTTSPSPATTPRRASGEIRGVWVSNTDLLDWDDATRTLQTHGFNAMYV